MALRTAKKSVREASISENGPGCKAVVHQRHGEFYEGQGTPQPLSGLGGSRRVAWAVGLQQPENAPSRQSSRIGFPHFEDFLANLERDMSLVETELSAHNRGKLDALQKTRSLLSNCDPVSCPSQLSWSAARSCITGLSV